MQMLVWIKVWSNGDERSIAARISREYIKSIRWWQQEADGFLTDQDHEARKRMM